MREKEDLREGRENEERGGGEIEETRQHSLKLHVPCHVGIFEIDLEGLRLVLS